jgi:hypothetical protein
MQNEYPASAIGLGGRQQRTGPEYGNIYDHHSVTYTYQNGVPLVSNCRQIPNCKNDMSAVVIGSEGEAHIAERKNGMVIKSARGEWVYKSDEQDEFYQTEHDELFASIRNGKPINNGEYMSHSTQLAILGRMATYTGQQITWDEALASKEDLTPKSYSWGPIPTPPIAVPGVTPFV